MEAESDHLEPISPEECVRLGAIDSRFFSHTFFPKTFRFPSPAFHTEIWGLLENAAYRYLNVIVFRGGAKTTLLRAYTAKRIAYGISRTILYVGSSEPHAIRSIQWLRTQVDKNRLFAGIFGLSPGRKWQENEIEVSRRVDGTTTWILGVGITSNSLRGINFDDYRPDTIVIDDAINDENAATKEQREKIRDLILGALKESLAPETEEPNAKLVMLQTPRHAEDASSLAAKDAQWKTVIFPCWTLGTWGESIDRQESAWSVRIPSEKLREEKRFAIARNALSVFAREQECRLITPETAAFRPEWIQTWIDRPPSGTVAIAIDPVPPPSEREVSKGLVGKDFEAIVALSRTKGKYYVLECEANRGHEPNWTIATVLGMAARFRATWIAVESIAYQRVLAYLLRQEMSRRGVYYALAPIVDRRNKYNRIVSTLSGPLSTGNLFLPAVGGEELRSQIIEYPNCAHDDLLDALAIALMQIAQPTLELGETDFVEMDEGAYREMEPVLRCP